MYKFTEGDKKMLAYELGMPLDEIEATIDDNQFLTISKVLYKATVNEPRSVTIQVSDKESLLKARLGAVLKLNIGRGDTIHNLDFEGIVKVIKESFIDPTDKSNSPPIINIAAAMAIIPRLADTSKKFKIP